MTTTDETGHCHHNISLDEECKPCLIETYGSDPIETRLTTERDQARAALEEAHAEKYRLRGAITQVAAGYDQIDGGTEQVKVYAADVAAKIRAAMNGPTTGLGSVPDRAQDGAESGEEAARRFARELERLRAGLASRGFQPAPGTLVGTAAVDTALAAVDQLVASQQPSIVCTCALPAHARGISRCAQPASSASRAWVEQVTAGGNAIQAWFESKAPDLLRFMFRSDMDALAEVVIGPPPSAAGREPQQPAQPPIVTICGSTRFRTEMADANRRLTLAGKVVLAPGVFGHSGDQMTEAEKTALDALHLRKIDLAAEVYVVNPGGYIGDSTRREIAYAEKAGKPVRYLVEAAGREPQQPAEEG